MEEHLPIGIAIGESGIAALKPMTVGQAFRTTRDKYPELAVFALDKGGGMEWKMTTFTEFYNLCLQVAKSYLKVNTSSWIMSNIHFCSLDLKDIKQLDCWALTVLNAVFHILEPYLLGKNYNTLL